MRFCVIGVSPRGLRTAQRFYDNLSAEYNRERARRRNVERPLYGFAVDPEVNRTKPTLLRAILAQEAPPKQVDFRFVPVPRTAKWYTITTDEEGRESVTFSTAKLNDTSNVIWGSGILPSRVPPHRLLGAAPLVAAAAADPSLAAVVSTTRPARAPIPPSTGSLGRTPEGRGAVQNIFFDYESISNGQVYFSMRFIRGLEPDSDDY